MEDGGSVYAQVAQLRKQSNFVRDGSTEVLAAQVPASGEHRDERERCQTRHMERKREREREREENGGRKKGGEDSKRPESSACAAHVDRCHAREEHTC